MFANIVVDEGKTFSRRGLRNTTSNAEFFSRIKTKTLKVLDLTKKCPLDTSIAKLRKKYTSLKVEHSKITKRIKTGSGLPSSSEPKWYHVLNDVFAESDVSNDVEEEGGNTALSAPGPITPDESSVDKAKLLVQTLNKRAKPAARSQTQAIAELAKSIDRSTDLQVKRAETLAADEKQRHDEYLAFKKI